MAGGLVVRGFLWVSSTGDSDPFRRPRDVDSSESDSTCCPKVRLAMERTLEQPQKAFVSSQVGEMNLSIHRQNAF